MIHKKIEIKARGMEAVGNLYTYFLDSSIEMRPNEKRPVILMCPGGGYEMTSDREARRRYRHPVPVHGGVQTP